MPRTSTLRLTLLHELLNEPAGSVTELATRLGKLRPSVSRSLHLLEAEGLVEREGREWRITSSGRDEADRASERLRESAARLNGALDAIASRVSTPVIPVEAFRSFDSIIPQLQAQFRTFEPLPVIEQTSWVGALTTSPRVSTLFGQQTDIFRRLRESFNYRLPKWDFPRWQDIVRGWMPDNLHETPDLDSVAQVALDEGLPLCWVPRSEIVGALIDADDREERRNIVLERWDDVLDDCEASLEGITHEWASQCSEAIRALRFGMIGPAQSHAANIVDSIVVSRFGNGGREATKARASEQLGEQPLERAAEYLTLLALARALTVWWPHANASPPDHFSRHATAHAVGHAGVFSPHFAMTAVMLATSLTVQFASWETVTGGEAHWSAAERPVLR